MDRNRVISRIRLLIEIELEVCNVFGITMRQLRSKTKQQPLPYARKVVMVVASIYGVPQMLIARRLCVDRSLVSKAKADYYNKRFNTEDRMFDSVLSEMKRRYVIKANG